MWILFNLILFVLFIIYIVKRFYSYLVGRAIQSVDWLIELLLIFSRCLMWTKFSHLRSMASAVADSNSWNSFSTNIRTRDKLTSTAEASLNVVRWPCSDSRRITALEGVHLSGQQTTRRQNFELGLGLGLGSVFNLDIVFLPPCWLFVCHPDDWQPAPCIYFVVIFYCHYYYYLLWNNCQMSVAASNLHN